MSLNPFDDGSARLRPKLYAIYALLAAANIGAWVLALMAFHDDAVLLGMALLAYTFGLRHAFDADHIAAIDNVVRKMVQHKKTPYTVGFFFSLGHSTVVLLAIVAIVLAQSAMHDKFEPLHALAAFIGTIVSTVFLLSIALANLLGLRRTWAALRRGRWGERIGQADVDGMLGGGLLSRILRPVMRLVSSSWHMYVVGFLFGLGFDTATEIGVLSISASHSAQGISLWTVLVFPALFTAGMSLMDTTDSVLMTRAYGWALLSQSRKLWYNLLITATSIALALIIGGSEALSLLQDKLEVESHFWTKLAGLSGPLGNSGWVATAFLLGTWVIAALVSKARRDRSTMQARGIRKLWAGSP